MIFFHYTLFLIIKLYNLIGIDDSNDMLKSQSLQNIDSDKFQTSVDTIKTSTNSLRNSTFDEDETSS